MPFSWTETKESTMGYIHENSLLYSLFFNPFVLCVVLVILVILIQYIFDKQYEEANCSYIVTFRQAFVVYIVSSIVLIIHDMLIKNKYRTKIKTLEDDVQKYQPSNVVQNGATNTPQSSSTMSFNRRPIDTTMLNKLYQEE